jgi:hypothetical protein
MRTARSIGGVEQRCKSSHARAGIRQRLTVLCQGWRVLPVPLNPLPPIPEATVAAVQAAFPAGNLYIDLRAEFGTLYDVNGGHPMWCGQESRRCVMSMVRLPIDQ